MHSDRPASDVLASHVAAAAAVAIETDTVSTIKKDLTQPTFQGQMVCDHLSVVP